jgi:hypothetical protein
MQEISEEKNVENESTFSFSLHESIYVLKEGEEFASLWTRVLVSFFNTSIFLTSIFSTFLFFIYLVTQKTVTYWWYLLTVIPVTLVFLTLPSFLRLSTTNLGEYLFGVKVVTSSGEVPAFIVFLKRFLYSFISIFFFSFSEILKSETKQLWSDKKVETFVVSSKKNKIFPSLFLSVVLISSTLFSLWFFFNSWHYRGFEGSWYTINIPGIITENNYMFLKPGTISGGIEHWSYNEVSASSSSSGITFTNGKAVISQEWLSFLSNSDNMYMFSFTSTASSTFKVNEKILQQYLLEMFENFKDVSVSSSTISFSLNRRDWSMEISPVGLLEVENMVYRRSIYFSGQFSESKFITHGKVVGEGNTIYVVLFGCKDSCDNRKGNMFIDSLFN